MPRKQQLSYDEMSAVAQDYVHGRKTQGQLAREWGVSRRTIHRALQQVNALPERVAWTPDEMRVMKLVTAAGLTPAQLQARLSEPTVSAAPSLKQQLVDMEHAELAELFYTVVSTKLVARAAVQEVRHAH